MKTKRPLADMLPVAERIAAWLEPQCERIQIAGSIRRKCAIIGDIEIVAIAKPILDLFGGPTGETEVDWLFRQDSPIVMTKNGPRYKQFTVEDKNNEYQVDLFLATPENWGYILMLRTGPEDFSKRMVTPVGFGGLKPNRYLVSDGSVWEKESHRGTPIETIVGVEEEVEMFRLWGMNYIEPEERR